MKLAAKKRLAKWLKDTIDLDGAVDVGTLFDIRAAGPSSARCSYSDVGHDACLAGTAAKLDWLEGGT